MEDKCDWSDFDGMIVGPRQGALKISDMAEILGFSHSILGFSWFWGCSGIFLILQRMVQTKKHPVSSVNLLLLNSTYHHVSKTNIRPLTTIDVCNVLHRWNWWSIRGHLRLWERSHCMAEGWPSSWQSNHFLSSGMSGVEGRGPSLTLIHWWQRVSYTGTLHQCSWH